MATKAGRAQVINYDLPLTLLVTAVIAMALVSHDRQVRRATMTVRSSFRSSTEFIMLSTIEAGSAPAVRSRMAASRSSAC